MSPQVGKHSKLLLLKNGFSGLTQFALYALLARLVFASFDEFHHHIGELVVTVTALAVIAALTACLWLALDRVSDRLQAEILQTIRLATDSCRTDDKSCISVLVDGLAAKDTLIVAASRAALLKTLPLLDAASSECLTGKHRTRLYDVLNRECKEEVVPLALAVMKWLVRTGDTSCLPQFKRFAGPDGAIFAEVAVREAAGRYLPMLEMQLANENAAKTLVRASMPTIVIAAELLRPAEEVVTAADELLRPSERS